jgi:hypothetical protein
VRGTLPDVKQADLRVGDEYAARTYKPYDGAPHVAQVRVVSVDGHGKATVHVVDPGPKPPSAGWGAKPLKRGAKVQIATRDIECLWGEWPARAAAINATYEAEAAKRRAQHEEYDRKQADRTKIDPDRALPEEYEERFYYEDLEDEELATVCAEYLKSHRTTWFGGPAELQALLRDLPMKVGRDILAASGRRGESAAPGSVAGTFARAAEFLVHARRAERQGVETGRFGDHGLGQADIDFVNALMADVAAAGGELVLPPVPRLPHRLEPGERAMASVFGWLRLAVGSTNGRSLHSPACHTIRSESAALANHLPWWQVILEHPNRLCGVCYGPSLRDLLPMVGFTAASDVWNDRGRDRVERWQHAAFQRLVAAAAAARARIAEPDITLTWRIVAALADDAPGGEGWDAYKVMTAWSSGVVRDEVEAMSADQRNAALELAQDRMSKLESALPSSQRLAPLPHPCDEQALRQRYGELKDRHEHEVPDFDLLLFTLPGAMRW